MTRQSLRLLSLCVLLAACSPSGSPAPTIDLPAIQTMAVGTAIAGLTGTAAARPTATATSTPIPPTSTPVLTATPGPDFSAARLKSSSTDYRGRTLIQIEVPGLSNDTTSYRATVNGVAYSCYRQADYPEVLFCLGPNRGAYDLGEFLLFTETGTVPLFEVSFFLVPTPTHWLTYFNDAGCVVEPLYQPSRPELTWAQDPSKAGCYAVSCGKSDGSICGTENSCESLPPAPCP